MSQNQTNIGMTTKLQGLTSSSNLITIFSSAIFISLFITAFVRMTNFLGSKDDWNDLKPKITEISLYVIFGTLAFVVASLMFFIQNPNMAIYFSIIVSCIALGLAFASLAVGSISR
jgi:hypothetical protein